MATVLMRLESRNANGLNAKIMMIIIRRIKNNNKLNYLTTKVILIIK